MQQSNNSPLPDELILNYHLMHPGGDSAPGDPNAAFYLDGLYHLHYILRHPWQATAGDGTHSFSFVHVTSPDMVHWRWQKTKLQPSFTGHGMFSGTGFLTKAGEPAIIYHGQASGRNQIAIAKDKQLSAWEKPYPVEPKHADGEAVEMHHWDPDCFRVGDTYYAISGGPNPPLIKSTDLRNWLYVGDFLRHELPTAAIGEDISCPNFFPIATHATGETTGEISSETVATKWMLLCISHPFGCRYYLGDWDAEAEQFVPEIHGRMNWRRPQQSIYATLYRDFFAPESLLTPDGRRVMWAWLATLDAEIDQRSVQSLPRELRLAEDGTLRIQPLRELETLRYDPLIVRDITATPPDRPHGSMAIQQIAELNGDAFEIRITIDRAEIQRKRFGFQLFAEVQPADESNANASNQGLPIMLHPETGMLRIGATEAPFAAADLAADEDLVLRIFIDKYLVEVFANDRQALLTAHMAYQAASSLNLYTYGGPTTVKLVEIWRLQPTNQGFFAAMEDPIWQPDSN